MSSSSVNPTSEAAEDPPPDPEPGPTPPDPEPVPDPVPPPTEPVTFEPAKWYSATWTCTTSGCPNENKVMSVSEMYSNNGVNVRIVCGLCGQDGLILSATLLDPQPPEE